MTCMVFTKSQLLRFKATNAHKTCSEDVKKDKNLKLQSLKSLASLSEML